MACQLSVLHQELLKGYVLPGGRTLTIYEKKPNRFLERLHFSDVENPIEGIWCAGFEFETWRCTAFADHLMEWLPEYALPEEELHVDHGNIYVKLRQAAVRVYTSKKYEKRGEAGEIALHAVCRDYFDTVPISPRVFYLSASNDVVKGFDLVHARFPQGAGVEIWLGESKLYQDSASAIADAIASVNAHIDRGFLQREKLLLGPQIPKSTPHYAEIMKLFQSQASLDSLLNSATFVVGIVSDSNAVRHAKKCDEAYINLVKAEVASLNKKLFESGLGAKIKLLLLYIPLGSKKCLVTEFDKKLKALQ